MLQLNYLLINTRQYIKVALAGLFVIIHIVSPGARTTSDLDIVGDTRVLTTPRQVSGATTGNIVQSARAGKDFHIVLTGLPTEKVVQLELGFAELEDKKPGARKFDVYVNDKRAISGFDIVKEAAGPFKSVVKQFTITPSRGFLDFHFVGTEGDAVINYIRVSGDKVDRLIAAPVAVGTATIADDEAIPADQQAVFDVETGVIHMDDAVETWNSGVPIGGIGTGKFVILPNGQFANFTINNSWDLPVLRPQGSFLAIATKATSRGGIARLMQVNPSGPDDKNFYKDHPKFDEGDYNGSMPFASWELKDKDVPLNVSIEAWSPVVPHNLSDSSLPGGVISVTLENPKGYPVSTALAFSWEDLNGRGGSLLPSDQHGFAGRSTHQDAATSNVTGFQISTNFTEQSRQATFTGNYFVGTPIKGAVITRKLNWNPRSASIPWWKQFATRLRLDAIPDTPASMTNDPKAGPSASTVCVTFNMAPKEVRRIPFIVSWYFPQVITLDSTEGSPSKESLDYASRFGSSAGVASYIAANRFDLKNATNEWHDMVQRASIPQWLKSHSLNSLFPLKTNSILLKDQRFAMLESPADMKGMLGPIDLRMASGDFLRTMYPELEKGELKLYASAQEPSGRIPRYIGNIHGALAGFDPELLGKDWVDPTACWLLQSAAYWRETGDDDYIESIKPAITKARDFLNSELEAGTVSESTNVFAATDGYASSADMTLLNTTSAIRAANELLGESAETPAELRDVVENILSSETTATFAGLLAAEYANQQAALPPLVPVETLKRILQSIQTNNFAPAKPVPLMESSITGDIPADAFSFPAPLQAYVGALGLSVGLPEIGLEPYLRMFQIAYAAQKSPWKQALRYNVPTGGRMSVRYHRSASSAWTLWRAMSGVVHDVPNERLFLNPQTIAAPDEEMEIPVFTPKFWGWLKYHQADSTGTLAITHVSPAATSSTITSIATSHNIEGEPENLVTFSEPFILEEGATLQLNGWPRNTGGTVMPQKPSLPEPVDSLTTDTLILDDMGTSGTVQTTASLELLYDGIDVPVTEDEDGESTAPVTEDSPAPDSEDEGPA